MIHALEQLEAQQSVLPRVLYHEALAKWFLAASVANVYYRGPRHMMRATVATSPRLELVRRDTLFEDIYDRESFAAFTT